MAEAFCHKGMATEQIREELARVRRELRAARRKHQWGSYRRLETNVSYWTRHLAQRLLTEGEDKCSTASPTQV